MQQQNRMVYLDRDAVCMADDVYGHRLNLYIPTNCTIRSFLRRIHRVGYLPRIQGNDVVWTLFVEDKEVASYYTRKQHIFIVDLERWNRLKDQDKCYLAYNHSPENRMMQLMERNVEKMNPSKEMKYLKRICK